MVGYDAWSHDHDDDCCCGSCERRRGNIAAIARYYGVRVKVEPVKQDPKTKALIDIAYDCGSLEAAQRRAREALKEKQ